MRNGSAMTIMRSTAETGIPLASIREKLRKLEAREGEELALKNGDMVLWKTVAQIRLRKQMTVS